MKNLLLVGFIVIMSGCASKQIQTGIPKMAQKKPAQELNVFTVASFDNRYNNGASAKSNYFFTFANATGALALTSDCKLVGSVSVLNGTIEKTYYKVFTALSKLVCPKTKLPDLK